MLAPGLHYVNSPIALSLNLTDASGNDYDPTTVTLKTKSPSGIDATYVYGTDSEVTRTDAGDYVGTITPDESGQWFYRWETTGGVIATEGTFLVQRSRFFGCDDYSDWRYI